MAIRLILIGLLLTLFSIIFILSYSIGAIKSIIESEKTDREKIEFIDSFLNGSIGKGEKI